MHSKEFWLSITQMKRHIQRELAVQTCVASHVHKCLWLLKKKPRSISLDFTNSGTWILNMLLGKWLIFSSHLKSSTAVELLRWDENINHLPRSIFKIHVPEFVKSSEILLGFFFSSQRHLWTWLATQVCTASSLWMCLFICVIDNQNSFECIITWIWFHYERKFAP